MNSPRRPNREKYIYTQPNTREDSRYLSRYPDTQRHSSLDTAEYSRYSRNHPYTKHTSAKLNAEKYSSRSSDYSPHSSNYSSRRKYNDDESTANVRHSSRYSDTEKNRHTFASERNKHSRLETHSSRNSHTERYTRSEVNDIDDMPHFSHSRRNESSRLEIFEDSVLSSHKYGRSNLNTAEDLEYSPLYSHLEECVRSELDTEREYIYLSRNIRKRTKMNTEADELRDPTYQTYREKEKLAGMETDEDSASFRYTRKRPYPSKNSAFVSLSNRDRNPPLELDNETNNPLYLHSERDTFNLDARSLHSPQSGRYMSIDQDAENTKSNANNTHTSPSSERRHSNTEEFDETDHKARPPLSKRYDCKLCPRRFRTRYPLHLHMVDAHSLNDGKYIPPIKKEPPKVVRKELCKPNLPSSKRQKCELCYRSVKTMQKHMNGMHNPKFKFKCELCHKTFQQQYLLKKHKNGMGTNKCVRKAMMAKLIKGKLELSKSLKDPASSESYSANLNNNLPVAEESSDLTDPHYRKYIPTEVSGEKNPSYPTSYSQSKGELPTELKISRDAKDTSTKEIETTAAENSTGSSQSSHTRKDTPIELNAVIASSSTARAKVESIVSPILPSFKCGTCNEKFPRKSHLNRHNQVKHAIYRPQFKYSCPFCTKKFKKFYGLRCHKADAHDNVHWNPKVGKQSKEIM